MILGLGGGEDSLELKQQSLVPDSVERLFDVKERCCTILFKLKGGI
jgi:hypothetical protein